MAIEMIMNPAAAAAASGEAAPAAAAAEPADTGASSGAPAGDNDDAGGEPAAAAAPATAAPATATDVNIDPGTLRRLTTLSKAERAAVARAAKAEAEAKAAGEQLATASESAKLLERARALIGEDPIEAIRLLGGDLEKAMAAYVAKPVLSAEQQAAAAEIAAIKKRLDDKEAAEAEAKKKADEDAAARGNAAEIDGVKKYVDGRIKADAVRWEVCGREPQAVDAAVGAALRLAGEKIKTLGRKLTDEEGTALLEEALDATEEHFAELGVRYRRSTPPQAAKRSSARRELETRPSSAETETPTAPTIDGSIRGPLVGNAQPRRPLTAAEAKAKQLAKFGRPSAARR